MIIGIDGNEANVTKRVGIGEYAYQLLIQFEKIVAHRSDITFVIYLKDEPLMHLPKATKRWKYRVIKPGKLWTQWRLPADLLLHRPKPDVFFSPSHYAPRISPVPTVMSVMDVSYLKFPELFHPKDLYQLKHWTEYSVKNATRVLTISQSSRNDIIKSYKKDGNAVRVVYPGIKKAVTLEPKVYAMNQLATKYNVSKNFVLFVGTLQPRKNIERLIESFSLLKSDEKLRKKLGDDLQLVIIGKKGWLYEPILEAPEKYGVKHDVLFLEGIDDIELKEFYKHAQCYILPSLYEGFGLPVLEAMQHDCPVITSNISSLPEAGGDAAIYVDPNNVKDIADKIEQVVSDKDLQKELIAKGREQVKKFSWDKSAEKTLEILEEVVNNSK